jgi:S1-C subfamily serine protease
LTKQLQRGFEAVTPIARASQSVVIIKTPSGEGSGFFCSAEGHILTTRHLVRPPAAGGSAGKRALTADPAQALAGLEAEVIRSRRNLTLIEQDLAGYERVLGGAGQAATRDWAEENHARLSGQYGTEKEALAEKERRLEDLRLELRGDGRDAAPGADAAAARDGFELILKDGTELTATLFAASAEHDLALLRLEGFRTPYLRIGPTPMLAPGLRVFTIGNPAGRHDAIASGTITGITPEFIHTDVPILPGNTGGPLITDQGDVLGISVAADVPDGASMFGLGQGKAIPIELALEAFPRLMEIHGKHWP